MAPPVHEKTATTVAATSASINSSGAPVDVTLSRGSLGAIILIIIFIYYYIFTFLLVTNLLLVVFLKVIFKVEFWWCNKHFFGNQ